MPQASTGRFCLPPPTKPAMTSPGLMVTRLHKPCLGRRLAFLSVRTTTGTQVLPHAHVRYMPHVVLWITMQPLGAYAMRWGTPYRPSRMYPPAMKSFFIAAAKVGDKGLYRALKEKR